MTIPTEITVTLRGETRTVRVRAWTPEPIDRVSSVDAVGAYQKRPGQRIWRDDLLFWLQADGSWKLATTTTILNRSGYRLIGWADKEIKDCQNESQHNSRRF